MEHGLDIHKKNQRFGPNTWYPKQHQTTATKTTNNCKIMLKWKEIERLYHRELFDRSLGTCVPVNFEDYINVSCNIILIHFGIFPFLIFLTFHHFQGARARSVSGPLPWKLQRSSVPRGPSAGSQQRSRPATWRHPLCKWCHLSALKRSILMPRWLLICKWNGTRRLIYQYIIYRFFGEGGGNF